MNVYDALLARRSTRAFTPKIVDQSLIRKILSSASHAPSGANTQPWQVAVVSGDSKIQLQKELELAFRDGEDSRMDYQYYPLQWESPYKERRRDCGLQMYSTLDITREDKIEQRNQWAKNYRGFDAPVILFFFMDPLMQTGSYIDYGIFLQSIMLAATEQGLATCPQASLAEYPDIVKRHLNYADDSILLCGMALGYENTNALINSYCTPRNPAEKFTRFFD